MDYRCDIEDAISEALEANSGGKVFGGATGYVNFYIDVLIFDGDESLEIIKSVLRSRNLPDATTCLLYTSPSPRDLSTSRMPSSA